MYIDTIIVMIVILFYFAIVCYIFLLCILCNVSVCYILHVLYVGNACSTLQKNFTSRTPEIYIYI